MGFLVGQSDKPKADTALPKPKQDEPKRPAADTKAPVQSSPAPSKANSTAFDVSKLCRAIAEHETHNCRDGGNSVAVNNCHGFRVAGKFLPFKSKADSYSKCEALWMKAYSGGLPTLADAKKWSGNDRAQTWQKNVTHFYYAL